MKRYWLFAYAQYYPQGGMSDFIESYSTVEEAKVQALLENEKHYSGWYYHIYDSKENIVVLFSTDNTRYGHILEVNDVPVNKLNDIDLDY